MVEETALPARDTIPAEHTWDLTTIYPSDAAWEQDIERLEQMATELSALQGTLAQSAAQLLRVLRLQDDLGALLQLAWLSVPEWEALLARAGFEVEALFGWFDRRPYAGGEDTVWIARRPD